MNRDYLVETLSIELRSKTNTFETSTSLVRIFLNQGFMFLTNKAKIWLNYLLSKRINQHQFDSILTVYIPKVCHQEEQILK